MQYPRFLTALIVLAFVAVAGCGDAEQSTEAEAPPETVEEATPTNTILTEAENAGLTTFRTAVAQADLDETLNGPGPFTVFAPSDEAFNALPEGTLESLLEPNNRDQLQEILTYHVLPRRVMSGDLSGEMSVASVEGQNLTVAATDGAVTLTDGQGNTATVTTADIEAGNGVIHVIDAVLMPAEDGMEAENGTEADDAAGAEDEADAEM